MKAGSPRLLSNSDLFDMGCSMGLANERHSLFELGSREFLLRGLPRRTCSDYGVHVSTCNWRKPKGRGITFTAEKATPKKRKPRLGGRGFHGTAFGKFGPGGDPTRVSNG